MLRLLPLLLFLCAAVHGKELKCDEINYYKYCWNLETHRFKPCWRCLIKNQQISEPDQVIFIAPTHENGTVVDVEMVKFEGGDVKHMPKVMHNTNNKQIVQMQLIETNAPVLNAQFFGNAGPNVTYFFSGGNHNLSMEAFAFQSFTNLEYLGLNHNGISAIPTEAFRKLHKLILLNLDRNLLSLVQKDWFYDLGNLEILHLYGNQLEEIPENSFQDLTNLKELHLDENNMEIITMKMFKYNKQLQLIDLSSNQIRQIQSGAFAHLSQLARLKINENDCIDNDFENQTAEEVAEGLTECYPTKESTCVVPQILNGYIISIDDNTPQIPGALFAASGLVKVVCNSTFTQIHDKANQTTNRCLEEDWEDLQWPTCHSELLFFSFLMSLKHFPHRIVSAPRNRRSELLSSLRSRR